MLVHFFQIIPILLFIASGSSQNLFELPARFPELLFLCLVSSLAFYFSLETKRKAGAVFFVLSLSLLYIFLLNKLYLLPSLGVLLTAVYAVILFKIKFREVLEKTSISYSILLPFVISLILFLIFKFGTSSNLPVALLAVNLSFASLIYLVGSRVRILESARWIGVFVVLASSVALLLSGKTDALILLTNIWFITVSVLSIITILRFKEVGVEDFFAHLFRYPEAVIISYFCILAAAGTVALEIPAARADGVAPSILDSLFTAMSAVCVTGLIVLDTPLDFTLFGQGVILILIQLGGFGIVAISSWVLIGLQSKRLSIRHEQALSELSGHKPLAGMQSTLRSIVLYFFAFEILGTLFLFWRFLNYDNDVGHAFWRALFTAVSAFCNAGFALQSDSLIPYQQDSLIMAAVSILIVAGGFAPLMAIRLPRKLWRGKLSLQEKLILSTTAGLLLIGFVFFIIVEWNHSLAELDFSSKLTNAFFQSVTTRTAGFNSVDFSYLNGVTPFFFMLLMFIGGNPGGTAGGVKTITFVTIFLAALAGIRGEDHIRIFNRKIPSRAIFRTMAVFSLGLATVFVAFFMLASTQKIPLVPVLFESVSALATVGLSLGVTGALDEVGKIIIIICMLLGRVGPLAFILLLFRNKTQRAWDVPSEDIYIS